MASPASPLVGTLDPINQIRLLKRKNAELAATCRTLEQKVQKASKQQQLNGGVSSAKHDDETVSRIKKVFARQRAKDVAEHSRVLAEKERELQLSRREIATLRSELDRMVDRDKAVPTTNTERTPPDNDRQQQLAALEQMASEHMATERLLAIQHGTQLKKELNNGQQKTAASMAQYSSELLVKTRKIAEENKTLRAKLDRAEHSIDELGEKLEEAINARHVLQQEIDLLEERVKTTDSHWKEWTDERSQFQRELQRLIDENKELQSVVKRTDAQLEIERQNVSSLRQSTDTTRAKESQLQSQLDSAQASRESLIQQRNRLSIELDNARKERAVLEHQLREQTAELETARQTSARRHERDTSALRVRTEEAERDQKRLQQQVEMHNDQKLSLQRRTEQLQETNYALERRVFELERDSKEQTRLADTAQHEAGLLRERVGELEQSCALGERRQQLLADEKSQMEADLSRLKRELRKSDDLELNLKQKSVECEMLGRELELRKARVKELETQLAQSVSKYNELTTQEGELRTRAQLSDSLNSECEHLRNRLNEAEQRYGMAQQQVGNLQSKITNLESLLQQLRITSESNRILSREYASALQQLDADELRLLQQNIRPSDTNKDASATPTAPTTTAPTVPTTISAAPFVATGSPMQQTSQTPQVYSVVVQFDATHGHGDLALGTAAGASKDMILLSVAVGDIVLLDSSASTQSPSMAGGLVRARLASGQEGFVPLRCLRKLDRLPDKSAVPDHGQAGGRVATTATSPSSKAKHASQTTAEPSQGADHSDTSPESYLDSLDQGKVLSLLGMSSVPAPRRLSVEVVEAASATDGGVTNLIVSWLPPLLSAKQLSDSGVSVYKVLVNHEFRAAVPVKAPKLQTRLSLDSSRAHRISVCCCVTPEYGPIAGSGAGSTASSSEEGACTIVYGGSGPNLRPASLQLVRVTCSAAVISWLNGNSNFYQAVAIDRVVDETSFVGNLIGSDRNETFHRTQETLLKPGSCFHVFTGLIPATEYRVTVESRNPEAPLMRPHPAHDFCATLRFTSKDLKFPSAPLAVQILPVKNQVDAVQVTWIPVSCDPSVVKPLDERRDVNRAVQGYSIRIDDRRICDVPGASASSIVINAAELRPLLSSPPPHIQVLTVETTYFDHQIAISSPPTTFPEALRRLMLNSLRQRSSSPRSKQISSFGANLADDEVSDPEETTVRPGTHQQRHWADRRHAQSHSPRQRRQGDHGQRQAESWHNDAPIPDVAAVSSRLPTSSGHPSGDARVFVALFDYDPSYMSPNDDPESELPFREGQLIKIYGDKDADGFYNGESAGRRGLVPCNMVSELRTDDANILQQLVAESEQRFSPRNQRAAARRRKRAAATATDPAALKRSQQSAAAPIVSSRPQEQRLANESAAQNYSQRPPPAPAGHPPGRAGTAVRQMIALYDYNPLESSPNPDLEVEAGDVITILGDIDPDGFYLGQLNGLQGLVPSNFLAAPPPDLVVPPSSTASTVPPTTSAVASSTSKISAAAQSARQVNQAPNALKASSTNAAGVEKNSSTAPSAVPYQSGVAFTPITTAAPASTADTANALPSGSASNAAKATEETAPGEARKDRKSFADVVLEMAKTLKSPSGNERKRMMTGGSRTGQHRVNFTEITSAPADSTPPSKGVVTVSSRGSPSTKERRTLFSKTRNFFTKLRRPSIMQEPTYSSM